ncbi:MAG TPA: hypothetical protein DDY14_06140 [Chromatiaceae bacterium]|nr:hypothetical protein [Chromatiaceae bacterium]HBG99148.1 hypothetical protein [Paracoccaceae bacterium]
MRGAPGQEHGPPPSLPERSAQTGYGSAIPDPGPGPETARPAKWRGSGPATDPSASATQLADRASGCACGPLFECRQSSHPPGPCATPRGPCVARATG